MILFREEEGVIKGEQISTDHKPDLAEERVRIEKADGLLDQHESQLTGKKIGPLRVWSKVVRQPGLAMTRSFGDKLAKTVGVISRPTVRVFQRDKKKDRALLVCSDGVSD